MKRIYILTVVLIPFVLLSCMPITPQPQNEATTVPAITPSESSYTGMQDVDTMIYALLEQDIATITSHVQFIQIPCTTEAVFGPPRCEEGQHDGTMVEVFPISATHGTYWTPDTIHELKLNLAELYAVYEVPDDTNLGIDWPIGDYGLIFRNGDPVPRFLTVFMTDGDMVRIGSNFVETAEQALPESATHILYRAEELES